MFRLVFICKMWRIDNIGTQGGYELQVPSTFIAEKVPRYLRTSVDKMPNTHGCDVPFGVFAIACKAETLVDASAWTLLIDTMRAQACTSTTGRVRTAPNCCFPGVETRLTLNCKMTHSLYGHFII